MGGGGRKGEGPLFATHPFVHLKKSEVWMEKWQIMAWQKVATLDTFLPLRPFLKIGVPVGALHFLPSDTMSICENQGWNGHSCKKWHGKAWQILVLFIFGTCPFLKISGRNGLSGKNLSIKQLLLYSNTRCQLPKVITIYQPAFIIMSLGIKHPSATVNREQTKRRKAKK